MERDKLMKAIAAVAETLKANCASGQEQLTVLSHTLAAQFAAMQMSPEQVTGHLIKITNMLDGKFDRS